MEKFYESDKKFTFIREEICSDGSIIIFEIARTDLVGLRDGCIDFDEESDKLIKKYRGGCGAKLVFEYVPNFGFDLNS